MSMKHAMGRFAAHPNGEKDDIIYADILTMLKSMDRQTRIMGFESFTAKFWPNLSEIYKGVGPTKRIELDLDITMYCKSRVISGITQNISMTGLLMETHQSINYLGPALIEIEPILGFDSGSHKLMLLSKIVRTEEGGSDPNKVGIAFCVALEPQANHHLDWVSENWVSSF